MSNQKIEHDGPEKDSHMEPKNNLSKITTKELPNGYKRLRVQFDITYKGSPGKTPTGDSLTEPDMSLSISQLLEHHTRGKTVPTQQPQYFNMEVPTFADITDVERYKEQLTQRLKDTTQFIKDEIKQVKDDKLTSQQKEKIAAAENYEKAPAKTQTPPQLTIPES